MPSPKNRRKADNRPAADYYKLKTKAVDDLVNANEENSPPVSKEELRKYRSGKFKIPGWLKANFIKFWFPAAVCYFIFWGIGGAMLDRMVVAAIVLGLVTDLLTNNALRGVADTPGGNDRWMMFPQKRYSSFVFNILYAFLLMFLVYTVYTAINGTLAALSDGNPRYFLGVEPILFGLFYLLCDTLLIEMKRLLVRIIGDAKKASRTNK